MQDHNLKKHKEGQNKALNDTTIEIYKRDIRVRKHPGLRLGGGARTPSSCYTRQVQRALQTELRNRPELIHDYVIHFPVDGAHITTTEFAGYMKKFKRKVKEAGCFGVYKREYGGGSPNRNPHVHLQLENEVGANEIRQLWRVALKGARHKWQNTQQPYVSHQVILLDDKRINYLTKTRTTNVPNTLDEPFLKCWGRIGPKPKPLFLHGTEQELAPIVRAIKNVQKSTARTKTGRQRTNAMNKVITDDKGATVRNLALDTLRLVVLNDLLPLDDS